jgi:hypothetical protein
MTAGTIRNAIPANEQRQTHAIDRAVTGIGTLFILSTLI